jgi:phenylacetate-CoA ligase
MRLFDFILFIKGYNLKKGYNLLKNIQEKTDEDFNYWQSEAKWNILKFHYQSNEIFRSKFNNGFPLTWNDVPVMGKNDFQLDLDKILTKGFHKSDLYISNTSGSSGHPFFFAKTKECHSLTWGIIKERYERHGLILGDKQARFYGIPLTWKELLKEKVKDYFTNRVRFPVFDLSDDILDSYLNKFKNTKFVYIYGYTSAIVMFAKYLVRNNFILKDICPTLKLCIVTSEVCNFEDRAIMMKGFGCNIINEYGASELDFIAIEDQNRDWIITEESLFVEILDENNKPVKNGEEGRIVITSLFNKAMPFIRYEIGDIGVISKIKKGKYRILQSLVGRTNDFALLPSGKKAAGLTFYYISKSLLEANGVMKEFIIKQTTFDTFLYEYVADRELNVDERNSVIEMMNLYLEPGLNVQFEKKETINRAGSGKLKHFQNLVN